MAIEGTPGPIVEQKEQKKISAIKTAKGSVYRYLPDGRTQRYKEATGELMEPMDILVFIPPWDFIKEKAKQLYPQIFGETGGEFQYEQDVLEYAQTPGKTIRVADSHGKPLGSMEEVKAAEQTLLYFITKNNDGSDKQADFTLPVAKTPKVGWYTFDDRRWKGEDGRTYHEKHMGNKVAEINYEN